MSEGCYTGSWSFSGYDQYCQCPFKFKCRHILHLPDPPGPAAKRGQVLHDIAQRFIEGKLDGLTSNFDHFAPLYRDLRDRNALCELEWGFLRDWSPCTFNYPSVWLRVKTDVIYSPAPAKLVIVDHKSGSIYEDKHELQTELYAVTGFILHPVADEIKTLLVYLDKKHKQSRTYQRAQLQGLIDKWEERVRPIYLDNIWPMRANEYCGTCPYRRDTGGPCQY